MGGLAGAVEGLAGALGGLAGALGGLARGKGGGRGWRFGHTYNFSPV